MSQCFYELRGRRFDSEIELDDFLASKGEYLKKYGDVVFDKSKSLIVAENILIGNLRNSKEQRQKWYDTSSEYIEGEEIKLFNKPYVGVNEFISKRINSEGNRWVPEFIIENYWDNRFEIWSTLKDGDPNKDLSQDEVDILFDGDRSKATAISDKDLLKTLRERIENRWKVQAKVGNAIHEVLLKYFQYTKNGIFGETVDFDFFKKSLLNKSKNKLHLTDKLIEDAYQICKNIKNSFPEGSSFFPEFLVTQRLLKNTEDGKSNILGMIDLVVVDPNGNTHVIDYKTSPKPLEKWSTAKRRTYQYLTAVYRRILERYGLTMNGNCKTKVLPIIIRDLQEDGTHNGCYVNIVNNDIQTMWEDISGLKEFGVLSDYVENNLEEYIPKPKITNVTFDSVYKNVTELMKSWFPNFFANRNKTRESIIESLREQGYLTRNEDGNFIYKPKGSMIHAIVDSDEAKFIDKVIKLKEELSRTVVNTTQTLKSAILKSLDERSTDLNFRLPTKLVDPDAKADWLNEKILPYLKSGQWKIVDDHIVEQFGIILLLNKITGVIDILKITSELNLQYIYNLSGTKLKTKLLTGYLLSDIIEKSKFSSLMLESAVGNIELMETMLVLNSSINLFETNAVLGKIQIVNPSHGIGISASNELILYSFNQLNKINKDLQVTENLFETKSIQFLSRYNQVCDTIKDIFNRLQGNEVYKWKSIESCISLLDSHIDGSVTELIRALDELRKKMEKNPDANWSFDKVSEDYAYNNKDHNYLYNMVLTTMMNLRKIDSRQLLRETESYFEGKLLLFAGTHLDNPGMLSSQLLNLLSNLVTQAYQNLRSLMSPELAKQRELINKLKKDKNFNSIAEKTVGNQVNLFKRMIRKENGDIYLVNPWKDDSDLLESEKLYLKFFLTTINKNRFPNKSESELKRMIENDSIEYFRIPVMRGDGGSIASLKGLFNAFIDKLKGYKPDLIVKRAREEMIGLFDDDVNKRSINELYEMCNRFDKGENSVTREDYINAIGGSDYLNVDLESILLHQTYAYKLKNIFDEIFPYIKAITISINNEAFNQNTSFNKTTKYVEDYVLAIIKNESITEHKKAEAYLNKLKSLTSTLILGFSPVQWTYQTLQGLFNDIKLIVTNNDLTTEGDKIFTVSNMTKAARIVYSDLFKGSNTPTLSSLINELYGLNDMDPNSYALNISSNKNGMFNIKRIAYKFASRPDYYNRLIIFVTQMIADGTLDAHSVVNGKLVYDWTKDKRFSKFAANPKSNDPEVIKQKSLYIAICKQLEREHYKNLDGSDFKFKLDLNNPIPLTKAYTTLLSEGYKALADEIYGYYSHERKSLIHFTMWGSLFMQFKTYWSGKKNQYLQAGGTKLQGRLVQAKTSDGKNLYYVVDENGEVTDDITTEDTGVLVYQWEGKWQEGILAMIGSIAQDRWNGISFVESFMDKWNNPDKRLKREYQSNFKKLLYDLLMIGFGAIASGLMKDWLKEMKDDSIDDNLSDLINLTLGQLSYRTLISAIADFNFIDSIGSPVTTWTPLAFEYGLGFLGRIMTGVTGDNDWWDVILNSSSTTKLIKPILDTFKPDMFKTEAEGGTFIKGWFH